MTGLNDKILAALDADPATAFGWSARWPSTTNGTWNF